MNQNDGKDAFDALVQLAKAGKYQEALDKHIWFHDASREFSGMGGVRLSYALDMWKDLGEKFPPAMESLTSLRDRYKEQLLIGKGTFSTFHDFSAINRVLNNSDDTLNVFEKIHNKYPTQAQSYYPVVEDKIIEKKRYDICSVYIIDPIEKYNQIQHLHETMQSFEMDIEDYAKERFVQSVCQLIEVMVAQEKLDIATVIQKKALDYFEDDAIKNSIG